MAKKDPTNLEEYIAQNYSKLVKYASRFTNDPNDIVHHIYIKAISADFKYVNKPSADWYFKLGIKRSSFSDFKKLYNIEAVEFLDERFVQEDVTLDRRVMFELLDEQIRFLSEFDRTVIEIYLRGENMNKLSRETEIPYVTIQGSLKRSMDSIKEAVAKRLEEIDA